MSAVTPEAAARAAMAAQLTRELSRGQARVSEQRAGYVLKTTARESFQSDSTKSVSTRKSIGNADPVAMRGAECAMDMCTPGLVWHLRVSRTS